MGPLFFAILAVACFVGLRKLMNSVRELHAQTPATRRTSVVSPQRTIVGSPRAGEEIARSDVKSLEAWLAGAESTLMEPKEQAVPPPLPPREVESTPVVGTSSAQSQSAKAAPRGPTREPVIETRNEPKSTGARTEVRTRAERTERTVRRPDPVSSVTRPPREIAATARPAHGASELEHRLALAITAAREDSTPGPSLALSSSLVRPLGHIYSVIALVGSPSPDAARRALGRVAASSRFFGLGLAREDALDEAHLKAACAALRRSDGVFAADIESDLTKLDDALNGAASQLVERVRGLLQ